MCVNKCLTVFVLKCYQSRLSPLADHTISDVTTLPITLAPPVEINSYP